MQIEWSKRPQDIVFHFRICVKHFPSKIPKKLNCRSHSGAQAPLFSKFALRFCKNVFEKVFYGGKRYYCAFVRCGVWGSKPHPFVISGRRPRCLLIDRLDYFLDYSLDYSLDYGYQKSKCLFIKGLFEPPNHPIRLIIYNFAVMRRKTFRRSHNLFFTRQ